MATPPTYVGEYETVWNSNSTPKTSASITTQVGDVLVVAVSTGDFATTISTPTNTGTAETWTLRQSVSVSSYCRTDVFTTVAAVAQTMTVSVARSGGSDFFGFNVIHYRGSDGVGASNKANATGGPSLSLTTTTANAAVVAISADWNAADGTTRTWRTVNSSVGTENTYFRDAAIYTVYANRWADAGAAGANTYGLSAPTGQKYSIIAVEIRGTTSTAVVPPPVKNNRVAIRRAANW